MLAACHVGLLASPPPAGIAPVLNPNQGFEIDGDLVAGQPTPTAGDWVLTTNAASSGEGVLTLDGAPVDPIATFHFVDPFNDKDNDRIFTGGSKWAADPNTWGWVPGKPSAKADINNLLFHVASDAGGHTWLVMSADRSSVQGESYIDWELLQNPIVRTNGGAFVSTGPHGGRTTNDLVLSIGFTAGGSVADFVAWRWEVNPEGGYHYADITPSIPPGKVFVALNSNTIASPYPVFGASSYPPNAFAEAAIDLTAMVDGVDACEPFGFVAMMVKTKSSTSLSAGIEDFLDPIATDFRISPLADAGADQRLCSEPGGTPFLLTGTADPGLAPIVSTQWRLVSGDATVADPTALTTTASVFSASATLGLEVIQLNGCTAYDEVVLTAVPRPMLTIAGPTNLCPGGVSTYEGWPGMESYLWSVSGNASVVGASNLPTVSIQAGEICDTPFTLSLAASSNICTVTTTREISVQDRVAPILVTGSNVTVECGIPWAFDPVSAYDACWGTNVVIQTLSTVTNAVPGVVLSSTRTWSAADPCGNTTVASQTVTVVDTTAPRIACPSNLVLECEGPSGTVAVFDPVAWDVCDTNVAVVCTPPSGFAFPFGVTEVVCVATDDSGNSSQCSFTVTVQDTTPPTIVCPPGLLVAELPEDSGGAVVEFDRPLASDNCTLSPTVICTPASGSTFPVGDTAVTCVATDEAGNTNSCTFTVRVVPYRVTVVEVTDSGPGGLREALLTANALPGETRIEFNIPGPGPHIIRPETNLPAITAPVILDGRSQPGFAGTPIIELDGTLAGGSVDGLVFEAAGNTVLGIAIYGFDTAITFNTNAGENWIQGTYLGVGGAGTNAVGNRGDGLRIWSAGNRIGGVGTDEGNLIVANGGNGIRIGSPGATNNTVVGNRIGVGLDGITPWPNGGAGIRVEQGAADNRIGSNIPLGSNLIAYNGGAGIALTANAGTGNTMGINLFDSNGGLGIDLGDDGVTPNDPGDSDNGPNGLQNAPHLSDARSVDGITTVDGSLTSRSNQTYRLDFYLNDMADPTGYGEGQTFLGFALVAADANGLAQFSISFPVGAVFTQYVTATATDPAGNTSEFSEARQVRTPPVAGKVPSDTNVVAGSTVTLCAEAFGSPPISYQWRLNGANIPGETNQCITLTGVAAQNAGAYSVIVYNALGGFGTQPASLSVPVTNSVPAFDNFADRQPLPGLAGVTRWSNANATREWGEPLHAGKPGGKSIWYSWKLPPSGAQKGIVTMGTRGSDFDTLLGVYEGDHVTNLTAVAGDEDRGGFFTSGLTFNAIKGREYAIAIDGYFGEFGSFVFEWSFEETPHLLPLFVEQPESQTVISNATATLAADIALVCGNGVTNCPDPSEYPGGVLPGLFVQWFFEGLAIPGATNTTLVISNVQPSDLGGYWIEATAKYDQDGVDRTIRSDTAELQINLTGTDGTVAVQAKDKFQDTLLSPPWVIGGFVPEAVPDTASGVRAAAGLTIGYTGTQVFNTTGSSSSSGETIICDGIPGGSSKWITLVSEVDGMLEVDTQGSSFDTILAVFGVNATSLTNFIDCSVDGNTDALIVPVLGGEPFTIFMDGQNGASGTLVLNVRLTTPVNLAVRRNGVGDAVVQVSGYPGMAFDLQSSTNLLDWTTLISTNSELDVFEYTDTGSSGSALNFYRARVDEP